MKTKVWRYCVAVLFLLLAMPLEAQRFFNLTAEEVKIDSVLPRFVYSKPLSDDYQDSIYTATVKYAEYVDMTVADIANYNRLSGAALPSQVAVNTNISVCRKKGTLVVSFCPLVFRNNKYQILASFMLDVKAKVVRNRVLNNLIGATCFVGRISEAEKYLLALQQNKENTPEYHFNELMCKGLILNFKGLHQKALDYYRSALSYAGRNKLGDFSNNLLVFFR